jgi:type II secretory pathway component PulF
MLFSTRIRTRELAGLCRRLGVSLEAGIDMRAVWKREAAGAGRGALTRRCRAVRDAVAEGQSLADALAATGDFFPPLFRELTDVGDESGRLGEVFLRLANHYDAAVKRRRIFLAAIAWPMIELAAAVAIVGFLIWILGVIGKIDILGFGLMGTSGLAVYVAIVSGAGIVVALLIHALRRGLLWTRPIQRGLLKVPVLGRVLETLALARLAWSLHLTLNTGMDVRRAIRLSLRSTQNARFTDQIRRIDDAIAAGSTIHEAFADAGGYPADFLDAMHIGEETGKLVEAMEHLSRQYEDRAKVALATLMVLAGLAVWCLVAAVIIAIIFRLAMFYIGTINDAAKMLK